MITEDQTAVIDFLASPQTHGGAAVERIDTHAAVVLLAAARAWKLKRAVRFDYLDSSTAERRRVLCLSEVELNRRTAPEIYRGVVAVTRERDGSLALGGTGTPIDWVVEMNRFDQSALFDRLAANGQLDLGLMPALAREIARFHSAAHRRPDHGGMRGTRWVIEGNAAGFAEFGSRLLDDSACMRVTAAAFAELERCGGVLDERRDAGFVRQCHGDLHLRNIVLLDNHPTLFDAVEFNDEIACIDVLYEVAFLLMDLWRRQLPRHANTVWNGYLAETLDFKGPSLMPLFLSCRAAVRGKTSATSATVQSDATRAIELRQLAREYVVMAERLLDPPPPCLVAIGGRSGTGKSTLALALAPSIGAVPGAVVLRSDEVRKRLCGVRAGDHLDAAAYSDDVSHRVYATLAERASLVVRAGHAAIVDAVYARATDRHAIERVAAETGVPFCGFWLEAPHSTLVERVERRLADVSDANADIVRRQRTQGTGGGNWQPIDASRSREAVLRTTEGYLSNRAPVSHQTTET